MKKGNLWFVIGLAILGLWMTYALSHMTTWHSCGKIICAEDWFYYILVTMWLLIVAVIFRILEWYHDDK